MKSKTTGLIIIIIGIMMTIYTGFNFVTTERMVNMGQIHIDKEKNHAFQWSPIVGVLLLVGGIVIITRDKKVII
jgi:uncharacterized membrane protein YidH (DUF202 family)